MSAPQQSHATTTATAAVRVAEAGWALAAAGQEDLVWGHVALRDPEGRGVWIKAAGWSFSEVTAGRVLLVGWEGERIEGDGHPHIESHIHLAVMRARPDVQACVHTHPRAVNAFSSLGLPMRAISHDGVLFVDPQVPRFTSSGDLVADQDRGRELAECLGPAPACLMVRHGLLAVGEDEAAAVMHAVLLTSACAVMLQALSAGELRSWSDDAEVSTKKANAWPASQLRAGYAHLRREGQRLHAAR